MIITLENKEIIGSRVTNVHDGRMGPICYNYEEKSCSFELLNPEWNKRQTFCIKGIIYMEIQSCEFWSPGIYVLEWDYDKKETKLKELIAKNQSSYKSGISLLDEPEHKYFEHMMYFNSGDEIRFVCEEVEFHEYKYYEE